MKKAPFRQFVQMPGMPLLIWHVEESGPTLSVICVTCQSSPCPLWLWFGFAESMLHAPERCLSAKITMKKSAKVEGSRTWAQRAAADRPSWQILSLVGRCLWSFWVQHLLFHINQRFRLSSDFIYSRFLAFIDYSVTHKSRMSSLATFRNYLHYFVTTSNKFIFNCQRIT